MSSAFFPVVIHHNRECERDLPAALNNVAVVAGRRGDRAVADRLFAAAITASPRYYELAVRNRETLGSTTR